MLHSSHKLLMRIEYERSSDYSDGKREASSVEPTCRLRHPRQSEHLSHTNFVKREGDGNGADDVHHDYVPANDACCRSDPRGFIYILGCDAKAAGSDPRRIVVSVVCTST